MRAWNQMICDHDAMINVVIATINQAINHAVIDDGAFTWLLGRASRDELGEIPRDINEFREEAKSFVRNAFKNKPHYMKLVEDYWRNPTCKDCGVRIDWPREYCFRCLSPKERLDSQMAWQARNRGKNAKLQR